MNRPRPGKGRTLTYSERRAIRDAGDSAYRWFEELVYTDHKSIALPLPTARVINSALWVLAASITSISLITAALTSDDFSIAYVVGAIATPVSLVPLRHAWNRTGLEHLRPAAWVWPVLAACVGNFGPWPLLAAAAILLTPVTWWPALSSVTIVADIAATVSGYPYLPALAVALAAAIALKVAPPNSSGPGMPSGPVNVLAGWLRPPLNTARLHKPLPSKSLPWFVYMLNPKVRRTVNEARKNRSDQRLAIPDAWAAKIVGAVGERTTAMNLMGLPRNAYIQAHDLHVPVTEQTTANIDHVIIGTTGTWVVDAKQYKGTLTATGSTVRHDSSDLAPILRTLAWEAACLRHALDTSVNALILVPAGACEAPIEVRVPPQRNAPETTVVIVAIPHLADWLAAQDPTVYTGVEKLAVAAKLAVRTTTASTLRTPHLTVSRGAHYDTGTTLTLAPTSIALAPERR